MGFSQAIKSGFSNYVNFKGRARRSEYWFWFLLNFIIGSVLLTIAIVLGGISAFSNYNNVEESVMKFMVTALPIFIMYALWILAVFLPSIAVTVRRLHDTGKSGLYLLVYFVPLVLSFVAGSVSVVLGIIVLLLQVAGSIAIFVFMLFDSQAGTNKYGDNPKTASK